MPNRSTAIDSTSTRESAATVMSEQALAQACATLMYEKDSASRSLGIELTSIAPGQAVMTMTVKAWMLNGVNTCHGGFIFSLADSCFAFACNSRNQIYVAQSVNIDYLSPGLLGEILTASAVELKAGGMTGLYDVNVTAPSGKVVAYFRGKSHRIKGQHIAE